MIPRTLLAAAILALCTTATHATDLLQVWEAARQHDPQGAISNANRAAGLSRQAQAEALWRPNVALSASVGWGGAQSQINGAQFSAPGMPQSSGVAFATSVTGAGATRRLALSARQPLYNPERMAQSRQLGIAAAASEHEWKLAQQDWMLQTTQRYFDVVLAERRWSLIVQQQAAVDKALTEAKDRFAIGDIPITDTLEAGARAQALNAQVIAAANELDAVRFVLSDITGIAPPDQQLQRPTAAGAALDRTEPLADRLSLAELQNPMIKLQEAQLQAAQQEVRKHSIQASPTVDLVAQASREEVSGSGDFGSASNSQSQQMLGVMLNLPLYTGGWRSAKLQEALHLEEKTRAELERARLQIGQMTRAAWLAVHSGRARIAAQQAAHAASQERLAATQLGRQVGDRTTLDLLNAHNDAAAAELALLQTHTDLLLSRMRLEAMSGQLNLGTLQSINTALQP